MGVEKLFTKTRAERLVDPEIQDGLDAEWERVKESIGKLGDQSKKATAGVLYNSLVRPFVQVRVSKKKTEFAPAKQLIDGSVDSVGKVLGVVGRVLLSSGRATKYGIRRALVI